MTAENELRSGLNTLRQKLVVPQQGMAAANTQLAAESPTFSQSFPKLARYRALFITGLALFLVWQVVTRGMAAYLADDSPEAALWFRSTEPQALTKLADAKLNPERAGAKGSSPQQDSAEPTADGTAAPPGEAVGQRRAELTGQDLEQARTWAERALRNDPLNARALRVLGQLAQRSSNEQQADALMLAAAERSLRESFAVYWIMLKSYRDADYAATLRYADILMRTRQRVQPYVNSVVAKLAETPEASGQVKQLLAQNPPWRSQFFAYLPQGISDARTPLDIFLSLKDTGTPPTASDLKPYLEFLIKHDFHDLAYYAWLQFLPPEQLSKVGRLFNGNFQIVPSGLPFDWVLKGGNGVTLQVAERLDQTGDNALFIEFGPGRVEFGGVTQMILLPPGSYELRGLYKSDLVSQRGLQWRVLCGSKSVGESRPLTGTTPSWGEFEVSFSISEDCPVQTIQLALDARSTSETFVSGSIWYDDLSIGLASGVEQAVE